MVCMAKVIALVDGVYGKSSSGAGVNGISQKGGGVLWWQTTTAMVWCGMSGNSAGLYCDSSF